MSIHEIPKKFQKSYMYIIRVLYLCTKNASSEITTQCIRMQNLSTEYIIWRLRQNIVSLLIECEDEIKKSWSQIARNCHDPSNSIDEKKSRIFKLRTTASCGMWRNPKRKFRALSDNSRLVKYRRYDAKGHREEIQLVLNSHSRNIKRAEETTESSDSIAKYFNTTRFRTMLREIRQLLTILGRCNLTS